MWPSFCVICALASANSAARAAAASEIWSTTPSRACSVATEVSSAEMCAACGRSAMCLSLDDR